MKKSIVFGLFAMLLVVSCKDDVDDSPDSKNTSEKIDKKNEHENMEIIFNGSKFESNVEKELLEELKICSYDSEVVKQGQVPLCSPESFKFLPLSKDLSLKNGFMLLIKAETSGFPLRRLLVFQRERGQLVKANGFAGNIIGRTPSKSGYDDLLLRFFDPDEEGYKMWYNCVFVWKDGKYVYDYVETIQGPNWGGKVKLSEREETSKSVLQSLEENKFLF